MARRYPIAGNTPAKARGTGAAEGDFNLIAGID